MLPAFKAVPRTVRLKADEANCRIKLSQSATCADKCSARAESCYKVRNFASRLFPGLIRGRAVMRLPICGIAVLVRIKIGVRVRRYEFAHTANCAIGALIARRHYQFRAVRNKNAFALMRCAVRQVQLYGISKCGTDHRVGDTGVAARRVDDRLSGHELSGLESRSNHTERWAVLNRAARIEPFRLSEELNVGKFAADSA